MTTPAQMPCVPAGPIKLAHSDATLAQFHSNIWMMTAARAVSTPQRARAQEAHSCCHWACRRRAAAQARARKARCGGQPWRARPWAGDAVALSPCAVILSWPGDAREVVAHAWSLASLQRERERVLTRRRSGDLDAHPLTRERSDIRRTSAATGKPCSDSEMTQTLRTSK